MSIRIMSSVWEISLPDSEKIVLLALADNANDEGACWPSIATIARKCSKSERTVQTALRSLEAAGHISRKESFGVGVTYSVHPRNGCTPAKSAPVQSFPEAPAMAAPHPRNGCTQTIKEPSKNHQAEIPEWVPKDAWRAFAEMRKLNRKPITGHAAKLLIKKLEEFRARGIDVRACIEQSTMNGWQGLFEVKAEVRPNGRSEWSPPC